MGWVKSRRTLDEHTAGCEAAAVGNWWEGWIGALLAAAITVGATVWWDARMRRRERLEDAVVRLHSAADRLGNEAQRLKRGDGRPEELAAAQVDLGSAFLLLRGLATRRVAMVPARIAAPARSGLALTMDWFWHRWLSAAELSEESGAPTKAGARLIVETCQALSIACHDWVASPMDFWPNRDLGWTFVERVSIGREDEKDDD